MKFDNIRSTLIKFKWFIYAMVCMLLFLGCSESPTVGEDVSKTTGSISFSVVWKDAASSKPNSSAEPRALTDNPCQDYGITTIIATVYNSSHALNKQSPQWDCGNRGGTISGVSPGQMYVVIEGYVGGVDAFPEWRGVSTNIQVVAGQTNKDLDESNPIIMDHTSDATAPTIVATNPTADATDVATNASVTVEFSEPLAPTTIDSNSFFISDSEGNQIPSGVEYTPGTTTALLVPNSEFVSLQTYSITVVGGSPAGIFDLAGHPLAATVTWDFTTSSTADNTPPEVADHDPVGDSVGEGASIQVAFNEPMNPYSISVTTFLVNNGTTNISGSIFYQADNGVYTNVATFDPLVPLEVGTEYTITIVSGASGVKDLAGNPLQADYGWSFTTTAAADTTPPTVAEHAPVGSSVAVSTSIQVTFSEPMNPDSITNQTFLVNDGTSNIAGSISYVGDVATFDPLADLESGRDYSVTIVSGDTGVKDLAGNPLGSDYGWSFTTESDTLIWDQGNWDQKKWN
jgi:hypothetical protein